MMSRAGKIAGILLCVACAMPIAAQTALPIGLEAMLALGTDEDYGTSRFTAMAGAMTAVGGDPSAAKVNPAGLGVYRHSQFSVSADCMLMHFWQNEAANRGPMYSRWHLAQMSYVFALVHPERLKGIVANNLMISYSQRAEMTRSMTLNDRNERPTTSTDWVELYDDEYGSRRDIDLHYAMNISNRCYWGIGMTLEWMNIRQTLDRWEYQSESRRSTPWTYDLKSTNLGKAVGWGATAGLLVHPVRMLRIGASIESPMVGRMRQTDYYTEQINNVIYDSPDRNTSWKYLTPMKVSAGLALQWKDHGLLSLQYDMRWHALTGAVHTARVGIEGVINKHLLLDAGYAYTTAYNAQQIGVGFNYVGHWLRLGFAYQHRWSTGMAYEPLYYYHVDTYRTAINRIVVTFQWNS